MCDYQRRTCCISARTDNSLTASFFYFVAKRGLGDLERHFQNRLRECLEDLVFIPDPAHTPTCHNSPPLGGLPVSLNFGDSSQDVSDIVWIRRRICFHQPASSTPNKHRPSLPKAPRSVIAEKMQRRGPVYYFQFLLEKVNLMSIIGS